MDINTPKIKFKNSTDFINKKNMMFDIIKQTIKENECECESIYIEGLSNIYKSQLDYIIYKELNNITNKNHHTWCKNTSYNIVYSIESSINALKHINKLNSFTIDDIEEFIYKNIIWQLGDGTNNEAILDDIFINKLT